MLTVGTWTKRGTQHKRCDCLEIPPRHLSSSPFHAIHLPTCQAPRLELRLKFHPISSITMESNHRKSRVLARGAKLTVPLPAYRRLALPAGAPFELKPSPGKYWGAFATRPIKKAELILEETPLFVVKKWHTDIVKADIVDAFHRLTWHAKMTFLTVCALDSVCHEGLKEAFLFNCFHACGGEKVTEFSVIRSRFNHSCLPNCSNPQGFLIFANHDIEAGDELVFSYGLNFMHKTAFERGRDMKVMGFSCDCSACAPGADSQLLSDMRRRLARGLCVFIYTRTSSAFATRIPRRVPSSLIPSEGGPLSTTPCRRRAGWSSPCFFLSWRRGRAP